MDKYTIPTPDQIGPASGQKNLGDINNLNPNDFSITADLDTEINLQTQPVTWMQEPEFPDTFTPIFTVPQLGQKLGSPRKEKELYSDEKMMIVTAFANDVAEWLFGKPMFNEVAKDDGTFTFEKNAEFYDI